MGVTMEHVGAPPQGIDLVTDENDEITDLDRREALDTVLARLRAGEREPWLCVAGGELAAQLDDWPLALECLRRLDPLGVEAIDLRGRLEALRPDRRIPEPPDQLASDPADLVARVFTSVATPSIVMARAGSHGYQWLAFVAVAALGGLLPGSWSWVAWSATITAHFAWLLWVGIHVRDDAWCNPSRTAGPVTDMEACIQRTSWLTQGAAMLAIVGTLGLGFFAGLGWFLLLTAPAAVVALLLLMSEPLHGVGWGFPFASTPRPREWCAMIFAGVIVTAAGLLSAFLAWTGFGAMLPHLLVTAFTWTFVNRTAGLLAHRVHLRLSADARSCEPLPGPTAPPVIHESHGLLDAGAATPVQQL